MSEIVVTLGNLYPYVAKEKVTTSNIVALFYYIIFYSLDMIVIAFSYPNTQTSQVNAHDGVRGIAYPVEVSQVTLDLVFADWQQVFTLFFPKQGFVPVCVAGLCIHHIPYLKWKQE